MAESDSGDKLNRFRIFNQLTARIPLLHQNGFVTANISQGKFDRYAGSFKSVNSQILLASKNLSSAHQAIVYQREGVLANELSSVSEILGIIPESEQKLYLPTVYGEGRYITIPKLTYNTLEGPKEQVEFSIIPDHHVAMILSIYNEAMKKGLITQNIHIEQMKNQIDLLSVREILRKHPTSSAKEIRKWIPRWPK